MTPSKFPFYHVHLGRQRTDLPTRLLDVVLSCAVARHWPNVSRNAVDPGWVKTKMGGASAPGSAKKGAQTPTWLASSEPKETGTGKYYASSGRTQALHPGAKDERTQEELLKICEKISGVAWPK